jgi:hypothetical protein
MEKKVNEAINPAEPNLFEANKNSNKWNGKEKAVFHTVVAKLLYLGKRGRPYILLAVQFLRTCIRAPNEEDWKKLDRVLGYLMSTKNKMQVFDKSKFEGAVTYTDASVGIYEDRKDQWG